MKVDPNDVLWLSQHDKLPRYIINAWRVHKAEDPACAARTCIEREKQRRAVGVAAAFTAAILFGSFGALVYYDMSTTPPEVFLSRSRSPWIAATMVAAVGITVLAITRLSSADFTKTYATQPDEFGYEFGRLLGLVHAPSHTAFGALDKGRVLNMVTRALVQTAIEVLQAEKQVEEHRKDRFKEGWMPSYVDEIARDYFRDSFELAKRFDLANSDGWGPYFEAAKAELAKSKQPAA